jgi:hypothetical protein
METKGTLPRDVAIIHEENWGVATTAWNRVEMGLWSVPVTKTSFKGECAFFLSTATFVGHVQAALHLGLRHMEWLFLTCHNYWIVFRLVSDNDHPHLVYSPEISIENSSAPFRAFIGAILSVVKGVAVQSSAYSSDMEFDTINGEEVEDGSTPKDAISHDAGTCQRSTGSTNRPATHSCVYDGSESNKFELNVRQIFVIADSLILLIYSLGHCILPKLA